MATSVHGLSWFWIALALTAPPALGFLAAFLFWRKNQMIFGSIVGTGIIFGAAITFILREYADLDRMTNACLDAGIPCWPEPSAFTRFAIYAFIALFQVLGLFYLSLIVEERVRRRGYAREWR